MRVSFVCPSAPAPMGGVAVLYEFASGLRRRGHEVHIAHGAFWGRPGVRTLEELAWFAFEPGIEHHFGEGVIPLPEADVIFGTGASPELGLPVLIVQGFEMFPKEMEAEVFRSPGLKVCVASWLVDVGTQYGAQRHQLVHVPMGIDHRTFRIRQPIDRRPANVGMLYNSHPAKGWAPGRQALEQVHSRVPEMRALVFGTERPTEALPPWITFIADPPAEMLVDEIYNQCRVFVQPSLYEGFGLTAVEAMACGCALVSTDNGGSRDYALAGDTALTTRPGDSSGLALCVEQLLRDEVRRVRLASTGHQYVQRFEWERAAKLLEAHLERYLADPAAFLQPARGAAAESGPHTASTQGR